MTVVARVVFALLVGATFSAFLVAQRLKHTPPVVQSFHARGFFSPNGDGRFDREGITFRVKHTDDVTAEIVNASGDAVRTLFRDRRMLAYRQLPTVKWDGITDAGRRAPDGAYRVRVTLRNEGRSVTVPRSFRLDVTPPRPHVLSIGPERARGPELLPNRQGYATVHTSAPGRKPEVLIFKTAPGRPRLVDTLPLKGTSVRWSAHLGGRAVSAGTYLAVARWRDQAGNVGTSVPLRRGTELPVIPYGERLPGRGGITVRYLEIQPPSEPVKAGAVATVGVDARGACFRASLRRIGAPRPVRRWRSCHTPFHLHAPAGRSGVFLFEARTARHVASAPLAIQGGGSEPVLVVLPYMTWQGRNPIDDQGDGAPDTLERGVPVRLARVLAGGRLPSGFTDQEGPLLAFLGRKGKRFDVTTDVALAHGRGAVLRGHRGLLLPGDVRWLPGSVQLAIRRFVARGGTLLLTGLDSLRREATLTSGDRLVRPTAPAGSNVFGARLRPVVHRSTTVTNLVDHIQLFSGDVFGGTGVFGGFAGFEATAGLGPREQLAASAVTDDGQVVIVAARFGKGLVIRTGLVAFPTRLTADANSAELVQRAWTLLSR